MTIEWHDTGHGWSGRGGVVTLAHVRYAEEGEAEGGLGAFVRFMAGALRPNVKQPDLSPAGWYWQGTVESRGVWCSPQGPFKSAEEARGEADRAFEGVSLD